MPIGSSTAFAGTFDGQGYVIHNLTITGNRQYNGLLGFINRATIKNIGIESTNIKVSPSSGRPSAGSICGWSYESAITNCYNTGTGSLSSSISSGFSYVGGICGESSYHNSGGNNNCYNTGDVFVSAASAYAGGICGESDIDSNTNCYNTGDVTAYGFKSAYVGGVCGSIKGGGGINIISFDAEGSNNISSGGSVNTRNCYNTGKVSASADSAVAYSGGICGYSTYATLTNCYWHLDSIQVVNNIARKNEEKNGIGRREGTDTTTPLTTTEMLDMNFLLRADQYPIKVYVGASEITFDQPPIIENSRTLVPLRAIFEALGASVDWDGGTKTVTAVKGGLTISLQIGSNVLNKNGEKIILDVSAQLVNSRTLVPVRAVAESFGAIVEWDEDARTVIIN